MRVIEGPDLPLNKGFDKKVITSSGKSYYQNTSSKSQGLRQNPFEFCIHGKRFTRNFDGRNVSDSVGQRDCIRDSRVFERRDKKSKGKSKDSGHYKGNQTTGIDTKFSHTQYKIGRKDARTSTFKQSINIKRNIDLGLERV